MITLKHTKIYKKYNGDTDGFARISSADEKALMSDGQWTLINNIIQEISIVKKGLASESFVQRVDEELNHLCDTKETITALKELI